MDTVFKGNVYVVGEWGTGKTRLIYNLISEERNESIPYSLRDDNVDWVIKDDNIDVQVNFKSLSDIAQKENYVTDNSIFIIISYGSNRDIVLKTISWIREIEKKSPTSTILVVYGGVDYAQRPQTTHLNSLRFQFPQISDIFFVENFERNQLQGLKFVLRQIALNKFSDRLRIARELIKDNLVTKGKTLDLGNCGITDLLEIPELFRNTHLETLILSNEWGELANGKWRKVESNNKGARNSIGSLPFEIVQLHKLKTLIAGGDWNKGELSFWNRWRIDDLNRILKLKDLEYLNVSNNRITEVLHIADLKKLKVLHLNNNEIKRFAYVSKQTALTELYISNNHITDVSFVNKFPNIETLDLHVNRVSDITSLHSIINKLGVTNTQWSPNTINIANNPLTSPPIEVVNTGKEAVLDYLQEIKLGKPFINKDVKLILVGNSEVGKTTLSKYLDNETDLEKDHSYTHWMEEKQIKSKKIIGKIKAKCTINLFDFGGHDYFHDTHHLFFGSNTIYILLWDKETNKLNFRNVGSNKNGTSILTQTQDYPLKYWLDAIKYFIKGKANENFEFTIATKKVDYDSLALVIQSKVREREDVVHLNNKELIEEYPFIYDVANISLRKVKRNLDYFDDLLVQVFDHTLIIGARLPWYYGDIKKALESYSGHPVLTIKEFHEYCNKELQRQITLEQARFIASYLKQIGTILYYPKGLPDDRVYLDKKWIIKQIYNVLQGLVEKNGEFDEAHLKGKLPGLKKDDVESVVALMSEFKIIFRHPKSKLYIAPLYLPLEPLQPVRLFLSGDKWPYRRFIYKGFIHKGVILNFFQEYGKLVIGDISDQKKDLYYYWKDGLVIKDSGSEEIVMIKFYLGDDNGNAFIDIIKLNDHVQTAFVNKIIDYIKEINADYEIEETVTVDGKNFVSIDLLNEFAREGRLIFTETSLKDLAKPKERKRVEFKLKDFKMYLAGSIKLKKVVISYSKKDIARVHTFIRYLRPLVDLELIEQPWYCTLNNPADEWDTKIQAKFAEADIVFFMVSEYFYSTTYIVEKEIKTQIDRYDKDKTVKIVPVILEHYDWGRKDPYNLKRFSAVPYQAKPISDFKNEKLAWNIISLCVREMIEKDLDPGKVDIISREVQELYERQVAGKLDNNS